MNHQQDKLTLPHKATNSDTPEGYAILIFRDFICPRAKR